MDRPHESQIFSGCMDWRGLQYARRKSSWRGIEMILGDGSFNRQTKQKSAKQVLPIRSKPMNLSKNSKKLQAARMCLARHEERRDSSSVQMGFQKRMRWLTSTLCARPPCRRSIWQRGFPVPQPAHWPYPDLGCSCRVRSCQRRFDAAPLSLPGLACLISLPPDAVATPWQRHRKNPVGGDASPNAATSVSATRIRIYSCRPPQGRYADLRSS